MTKRVTKRKRPETVDQKYDRLNRRIMRGLPVTAAEIDFVWREKSRRISLSRCPTPERPGNCGYPHARND